MANAILQECDMIRTGLSQEVRKGDLIININSWKPRIEIVRKFEDVEFDNDTGSFGLWWANVYCMAVDRKWVPPANADLFLPNVWKVYHRIRNSILKLEQNEEILKYGFDGRLIETIVETRQKVMEGFYDDKKKKK